ncbi:polyphenol oxidase family protein [Desulfovibrio inopinatus]|uniref:polyphenol oxidase family protein n=1 Tax=Desulfovibrio inopinatus TaxID=102109 RepID=UPI0003F619E4|nr:polyphenol oxidase family protein [Desulfovibrio inopinatus]
MAEYIQIINFAFPFLGNINVAFGTRRGGQSTESYGGANVSFDVNDSADHVAANREAIRQQLGFERWCGLRQVHGDDMIFEPEGRPTDEPESFTADGQATSLSGCALAIKTADCQPIMLAHTSGQYIAALHVGWRGNVLRFPITAVEKFCEHYCIKPADLMAVRGPSLGPGAAEFKNFEREFGSDFIDYFNSKKKTVDLWRLTEDQLVAAGLKRNNIFRLDLCTYSLPDLFFSYRQAKESGRQVSLIWIAPQ